MAKTKDQIRNEALGVLRKWKRAGAGISMGVGKTRLGLEHFQLVVDSVQKKHGRMAKGLVAAPTKKIIQGWKDEAVKWGMEHLLEGLSFTTYRSLNKQENDYDTLYLDECHSLKGNHRPWLTSYGGYIIGLTGTPPVYKNSEKYRMINSFCPIKYEYLLDEAVDDNILNDYRITVHLLELSNVKDFRIEIKDRKTKRVTKSWLTSEVDNYAYWSDQVESSGYGFSSKASVMRMKAMHKYPTKDTYGKKLLDQATDKCLLFANEQAQADKLCKHSYHSNNKDAETNMEKFEQGIIDKMTCVLQLSEGANIVGLKEIIILHAYGNNKKAAQRIGRALRLNPDDIAHIHILCFKDTVDVKWVTDALAGFNQDKITWYDPDVF